MRSINNGPVSRLDRQASFPLPWWWSVGRLFHAGNQHRLQVGARRVDSSGYPAGPEPRISSLLCLVVPMSPHSCWQTMGRIVGNLQT